MKCRVIYIRIRKCITTRAWNVFCIAGYVSEIGASSECRTTDELYIFTDGDSGKARATRESTTTDTRHAIWDDHRGKTRAVIERKITNIRHTIADGDGGKTRATIEYIKY